MFRSLAALLLVQPLLAADPPQNVETFRGKVEPSVTVIVRPRVSGLITEVQAKEGMLVKKGEILARLDARPFEVESKLADAQLGVAVAVLKSADLDVKRTIELFTKGAGTENDVKRAEAALTQAKAELEIATAKLQKTKLALEMTQIISPIDGKISQFAVDAGNLVTAEGAGATKLATIVQTDPAVVTFALPESVLLKLRKSGIDLASKPVTIVVEGDPMTTHAGVIETVGVTVDTDGTLRVQARVPNPKGELIPGATVRVQLETK